MPKDISFLALGDSYTIGESVTQSDSWPFLLKALAAKSEGITIEPTVIAKTGWTTADLLKEVRNSSLHSNFDMVSLLIGVNNQYQGLPLQIFRCEFNELLELAISFSTNSKDVFVFTIPDWGVSPFAMEKDHRQIAKEIDQFNDVVTSSCEERGISCIDITTTTRHAKGIRSFFASDGLHFSGTMHQLWVQQIFDHKFKNYSLNMDRNKPIDRITQLDYEDPLRRYRHEFINSGNTIYLDGNSLGKLPKATVTLQRNLVEEEWGKQLIQGWNNGWIDLSQKLASKLAQVIGADPDEVFVGDTTSLNLYKLLYAGLVYQDGKKNIVSDSLNFPSDLYVLQGLLQNHFKNHELTLIDSPDGISMEESVLESVISANTAMVTLSHVTYKSAFMYPMKTINEMAHRKGALVLWDLSHAVGAVPLNLKESGADMAVGCTYKYLNGGPGAPAFLYVSKNLQKKLVNPIWSWFSHEKPFAFNPVYKEADHIAKFAVSTPSILSLAAIEPGLDLFLSAGMDTIRAKSVALSELLVKGIEKELLPLGFTLGSPKNPDKRGSHIAIRHLEGYRINRALIAPIENKKSIIPDFRPPDLIRLGIAPLYTSFSDVHETVKRIKEIVLTEEFRRFDKKRLPVP
jgi:kynureninase